MTNLVSMKRSPEEIKKDDVAEVAPDKDQYPWGLEVRLENESLEKLKFAPTEIGGQVQITAIAIVETVSADLRENETRKNVTLQITDMALTPVQSTSEKADTLFDG